MAGILRSIYDWLLRLFWYAAPLSLSALPARCPRFRRASLHKRVGMQRSEHKASTPASIWNIQGVRMLICDPRATEMDVTVIGLQNAGKTSLLRVLAVSYALLVPC